MSLPEFDFNYKNFLDKTTVLYGETGTGKSFIITDILFQLQPYVDQAVVISPMDRSNHTYDRGLIPLPCIHYTISAKLLDDIWERQNALSSVYAKANDPKILEDLFNKISNNAPARNVIDSIRDKLSKYKHELEKESIDPSTIKIKIIEMNKEYTKLINMIWVNNINENRAHLQKLKLSKDEQYSLKYLNLNPRIVLIFDDCTDLFKKFKSHSVVQKLFYQGRWAYITVIIACHTDIALDPALKKNTYVSIYTERNCADAYFTRPSHNFDRETRQVASSACKIAFTPLAKHQKLAWVREERKFFKLTASDHSNFRFGSPYIWDYCDKIKTESGTMTSNNKFITDFA